MRTKNRKADFLEALALGTLLPVDELHIGISSPELWSHIYNCLLETIVCVSSQLLKLSMSRLNSLLLQPFKFILLLVFLILEDNSTFHFKKFFLTTQSQSPSYFPKSLKAIHIFPFTLLSPNPGHNLVSLELMHVPLYCCSTCHSFTQILFLRILFTPRINTGRRSL